MRGIATPRILGCTKIGCVLHTFQVRTFRAEAARAGIESLSRAGLPWDAFGMEALDILERAVPFEGVCLATIDPSTTLVTSSIKVGIEDPCEELFAHHEYVEDRVSLFTDLARRDVGVSILHDETAGDPYRSSRFRDLIEPHFGFGHELRAAIKAGRRTWGGMAVYRAHESSGFSPAEADFVQSVSGLLARGVRAGLIATTAEARAEWAEPLDGPAVVVFDAHGEVELATPGAEQRVEELGGSLWADPPPALTSTVAAARSLQAGRTGSVPRLTVRSRTGEWLVVHASPLAGRGEGTRIAVTIEQAGAAAVFPLVVAAFGLTGREGEVVERVLRGDSTAEIARRLHMSPYTVQDHLKSVFAKAGVTSRRELMSTVFFDHYAARKNSAVRCDGWFDDATTDRE